MGCGASLAADAASEHTHSGMGGAVGRSTEPSVHRTTSGEGTFARRTGSGDRSEGSAIGGKQSAKILEATTLPHGLAKHLSTLTGQALPPVQPDPAKLRQLELRRKLLEEHGDFLVSIVAILEYQGLLSMAESTGTEGVQALIPETVHKPRLEMRAFKSHTMDNVLVKKMSQELLHLEDPMARPLEDKGTGRGWLKALQIMTGKHVHCIKINQNPEITIGGYFILAQMVAYTKFLVSLDLSSNDLTAAAARVLSLGLEKNESIQELRLKDNNVATEGATSMAHMLRKNKTLLLLDLRMNNIRGPGMCVLADAAAENTTLTELDMRWNYTGECSDFVEFALLDLKKFCFRNMILALRAIRMRQDIANAAAPTEPGGENGAPSCPPGKKAWRPQSMMARVPTHVKSLDRSPRIGQIEVTIIAAKNLPHVIWNTGKSGEFPGMPQAYCVFSLNNRAERTSIMKKHCNPFWNHSMVMDVREVWQVCKCMVMHSPSLTRTGTADYNIGNVHLPIGSIINWRGVSHGVDGTWRAYHRPLSSVTGTRYVACKGLDTDKNEVDVFDTAVEAALAYDETAARKDGDKALLNFSGDSDCVGLHVKEEQFTLTGDDGVHVIGVQAGVSSQVRLRLKFFSFRCNYLEVHLDRASNLPKMDTGLGTCDAYCKVQIGACKFRSKVQRNSLDPEFFQTFRLAVPSPSESVPIMVSLFDWDRFDEDDHMGDAQFSIVPNEVDESFVHKLYVNSAGWDGAPGKGEFVQNSKGERSQLHLRFTFTPASRQGPRVHDSDHEMQT